MLDQNAILQTAQSLVRVHGADAQSECEAMLTTMYLRRDEVGQKTWEQILQAVRELERTQAALIKQNSEADRVDN
jgi:hypothetical protein